MKSFAIKNRLPSIAPPVTGVAQSACFCPASRGEQEKVRQILGHRQVQPKPAPAAPGGVSEQEAERITGRVIQPLQRRPDRGEIRRAPDGEDKLDAYLDFLRKNKRIEGKKPSKALALEMVEKGVKAKDSAYWLPDDIQYLLVAELMKGGTTKADRNGILEILERMAEFSLESAFKPGHLDVNDLVAQFKGDELKRLEDFFTRRFEGGIKQAKAGTVKARGEYIPAGIPLASLDIVRKTTEWLKSNKATAEKFFGDAWSANKILLLGEIHFDDVQRIFAADMLKAHGGNDVGLALEIHISEQSEVDYYIKHGKLPKDAKGWWRTDEKYKKLLDQARATGTQVIAMDTATSDERDEHMAAQVKQLAKGKKKILVYVGAMHIKEAQGGALGGKLASEFGGSSYAIDMFHPDKDNYLYWMIKDALPGEKSLGFDIDKSPLAKHLDPDITSNTFGANLDGYIFFYSSSTYK